MFPGASTNAAGRARAITTVLGCYAIAGGAVTLTGWIANINRLTDWEGNGISMMPNAAVAAMVAGAALLFLSYGFRRMAAVLGALVGLIGAATLFEYVTAIDLGIDRLLIYRDWGQRGTVVRGRMGPPGSTSFTLLGAAILLASFGRTRRFAVVGALLASAIVSLSLIGYLLGADTLYTLPHLTTIAMQTSTILLALGVGLVAAVPETQPMRTLLENSAAAVVVRRALPFVVLLPVGLGWLRLRGQKAGLYDTEFGTSLLVLVLIVMLTCLMFWAAAEARRRTVQVKTLLDVAPDPNPVATGLRR